jgi:hypothetical protein
MPSESNPYFLLNKFCGQCSTKALGIPMHSIDEQAIEAMRLVEGEFSVKTTTRRHYQNEDEKMENVVRY